MPISKKTKSIEKIASNLKNLLEHHSISIRKLAKAIDVTPAHLTKLAKCEYISPGLDVIEKISKFFKISMASLLGEKEIDFKNRPRSLDDLDCSPQ